MDDTDGLPDDCRTMAADSIIHRSLCRHHVVSRFLRAQNAIKSSLCSENFVAWSVETMSNNTSYGLRFVLGFSPHEVHTKNTFFGWILPTLRTSEFAVLQIVGLDAAVVRRVSPFPCCASTDSFLFSAPQLLQIVILLLQRVHIACSSGVSAYQLPREWHDGRPAAARGRS